MTDTDTTLRTEDGHDVLRLTRFLPHPQAKVWRAVTDTAHLAQWFPATMDMTLAVGETITFGSFGELDGTRGVITEVDEPRVFAFTWNGEALRIELAPADGGCELVFTHMFRDRPRAASFATGWNACFDAMACVVAGSPVRQMTEEQYIDGHERLYAAFDLLHGTAERDGDRWTLRLERQFPQHAGVWELLADGAEPEVGTQPPARLTNGYVTAGPVTAAEENDGVRTLAYAAGDGEVRWSVASVMQGTCVTLTQTMTGDDPGARATALAAWHTHLEVVAGRLRGGAARPWPADRTEELRRAYAAG